MTIGVLLPFATVASCADEEASQKNSSDFVLPTYDQSRSEIVATVNGSPVGLEQVTLQLSIEPAAPRNILDDLITLESLAQVAADRGFASDVTVADTVKKAMVQQMLIDLCEKTYPPSSITESDVQKYYDDHYDNYWMPELVTVAQIFCAPKRDKGADMDDALRLCSTIHQEAVSQPISSVKEFTSLAKPYKKTDERLAVRTNASISFPRVLSGKSRWNGPDSVPEDYAEVAFSMTTPFSISEPLITRVGVHILMFLRRSEEEIIPFEAVQEQIFWYLLQNKRKVLYDQLIAEMEREVDFEIHKDVLNVLETPPE